MVTHELKYILTGSVPSREDLLYMGGDAGVVHDGPVFIYYLRTGEGVLLVDTSFHMDDIKTLGIENTTKRKLPDEDPLYALDKAGVQVGEVTKIILTHAHTDHVGYIDVFPNAEIFVHQKELDWVWALPSWSIGYGPFTVEKLSRVKHQLHPIEEERYPIYPGVEVIYVGGHSAGSMAVLVDIHIGRICLCMDNMFLYKNLEEDIPIGLTNNLYENLAFHARLPDLADIFLPGHDPLILERYPDGIIR